ncbi:MotA/TolQ/ExbB proton channel family protein [Calditrichota bacterium]
MSLWTIFQEASLLNKLILLLLVCLSILSWAVIIERWRYFRSSLKADKRLAQILGGTWRWETVYDFGQTEIRSPAARVFVAASDSLKEPEESGANAWDEAFEIEREQLRESGEKGLPVLAIIASASPFIGLLGTVWGVMIAFLKLGDLQGQPALELVGPGIAEALIATAAGLFAAIPATVGYNAFIAAQRNLLRRNTEFSRRFVLSISQGRNSRQKTGESGAGE